LSFRLTKELQKRKRVLPHHQKKSRPGSESGKTKDTTGRKKGKGQNDCLSGRSSIQKRGGESFGSKKKKTRRQQRVMEVKARGRAGGKKKSHRTESLLSAMPHHGTAETHELKEKEKQVNERRRGIT